MRAFVEHTQLPLYSITMARGLVSDEHPLAMGYADPALNQAVHTAFREADLFLVIGKRIDYRLALGGPRLFPPGAKFVQVEGEGSCDILMEGNDTHLERMHR